MPRAESSPSLPWTARWKAFGRSSSWGLYQFSASALMSGGLTELGALKSPRARASQSRCPLHRKREIHLGLFLSIHHNNRKITIGNPTKIKLPDNRKVAKRDSLVVTLLGQVYINLSLPWVEQKRHNPQREVVFSETKGI